MPSWVVVLMDDSTRTVEGAFVVVETNGALTFWVNSDVKYGPHVVNLVFASGVWKTVTRCTQAPDTSQTPK